MRMRAVLAILGLVCYGVSPALDVTLYINKDSSVVFGRTVYGCAFNDSPAYASKNTLIRVAAAEPLLVRVINRDSLDHTFTIDGLLTSGNVVAPGDSMDFPLSFAEAGTYRYYSDRPYGALIGASGVILVGHQGYEAFFWNLFDLESDITHDLASDQLATIPVEYSPDLFYMNGAHAPQTYQDTDTYVSVQLGDTVVIAISNGGNMDHVLHFHGFHVRILDSHLQPERAGWIKDTVPVKQGDALTVMLIAGQPGVYPVHDHNLIAVTNAGFYPGGMLTQINVSP